MDWYQLVGEVLLIAALLGFIIWQSYRLGRDSERRRNNGYDWSKVL